MSQPVASTGPVTAAGLICAAVTGWLSWMNVVGRHGAAHACPANASDATTAANAPATERFTESSSPEEKMSLEPPPRAPADATIPAMGLPQTTHSRSAEYHRPAILVLDHAPLGEQDVRVAQHLRQGEERLRHGDVAPERLRDVVRRARPFRYEREDLVGPARVQGEAAVDQRAVVLDRVAVAGQHHR